tara:strand:- start:1193 stop:2671 length:1479 start_codon:yes stop_codon:yes gene_type:complete
MTKKVLFRADGSSTTGLGHLYRLFSLVEILNSTYDFVFVTHTTSTQSIIPKKYLQEIIPTTVKIKEEPNWLQNKFSPKEYIIIADGYQFNTAYQKKLKDKGYTLVYIDDLVNQKMVADLVINHSPYAQEKDYLKETNTNLALGTKYALLRPLFLKQANQKRNVVKITSAFVCFGGADPFNLTLKAVQALLNFSSIKNINVVLGGAYGHKNIFELEDEYPDKLKLHRNLSEERLIETIQRCNFAVVPSSTIVYEVCCVKMPILSGYYVDNQKLIYKGLLEKEIIFEGGDLSCYKVSDFETKIKSILISSNINSQIENQHNLFDGNIKHRLLGLVNQLNISFRRCNETDMTRVFNWSNDDVVRKNSYNSQPILLENHKKWYSNKIKDKNCLFLIALINDVPAGIVRYEIETTQSIVGVLVSREYRGQSLASNFLVKSSKLYFKNFNKPILAYIKKENVASIKAFENAGYSYLEDDIIEESSSFVYKLEKTNVKE